MNNLLHAYMDLHKTSQNAVVSPSVALYVKVSIASAAILLFCWNVSSLRFIENNTGFFVALEISSYSFKR